MCTSLIVGMSPNLVWQRLILPNGLTVLYYPRASANTTQLAITVKSGSNQEPEKAAGITHVLEHMLAGGSEHRIKQSRSVEDSGGILDFFTDHEQVTATLDVLPQKLPETSAVLSSILFDDSFAEEKFEVERKIILNELAEYTDDPTVKTEELLLGNLFKVHPVRRPVGGYPKTVKRLTLKQLIFEHQTNYTSQNMVLVLAGYALKNTLQNTIQYFQDSLCGEKPDNHQPPETFHPKRLVNEEKAGISQSYLNIGARTVNSGHKDAPILDLISTILGGNTSSRLFTSLREKHAVTYDVSSAHCKGTDYGYLNISCATSPQKVEKTKKLAIKEIENLRTELVSNAELETAKQTILGGVLRGMDNPHMALEMINYMEIQFKTEFALENFVTKIQAVTGRDIKEAAEQYLCPEQLCTVVLKPKK
jgi:predicted Zn-dependent peptidase